MRKTRRSEQVIWLRPHAPSKPEIGQACNGCGVCCAAEPCPVAHVFLWQRRGTCRALEWQEDLQLYRCGMLLRPTFYVRYLPQFLHAFMQKVIKRWIAAGTACDSDAVVDVSLFKANSQDNNQASK